MIKCNTMKNLKLLLFAFAALFLFSCSDDDNEKSLSSIVGRWEKSNTAFVFNSNKTGCHETDLRDEGLGVIRSRFTWSMSDAQLFLTYDGSGSHIKGTFMYYYVLVDDVLSVYYDDWSFMGAYRYADGK